MFKLMQHVINDGFYRPMNQSFVHSFNQSVTTNLQKTYAFNHKIAKSQPI